MKFKTVEEVKKYCMKNYENGLDWVIECCEDSDIQEHLDKGDVNKWLNIGQEIQNEERQAAKWYAYGTTDDEEIKTFLNNGATTETTKDAEYEDDFDDYDRDYCPSSTNGDYSPSNPWDAPGMSIHDFI